MLTHESRQPPSWLIFDVRHDACDSKKGSVSDPGDWLSQLLSSEGKGRCACAGCSNSVSLFLSSETNRLYRGRHFEVRAKVLLKFIVVGMRAVRRSFPACDRASTSRVSSFTEGRTQMKSGSHASTRMKVRPHSKPERRTRRQSQRPGLSRSVLRAARLAPAPVVAHL
jgi:hypothetical protein